ncbi:MAG: HIT family protein [Lachnospiraceae bacterium]
MKDQPCIFCRIAGGEIPSATIYEDEDFRVILDLGPASKGHALILPKEHYEDVCSLEEGIAAKVLPLAARIGGAMKQALGCSGFNLVQNNGVSAGQTVFHFHMHIIPRYDGGPDMVTWKPGEVSQDDLKQISEEIKTALEAQ